ncbi:MAG: SDR family oxidoreductase [Pelovirga sp.]
MAKSRTDKPIFVAGGTGYIGGRLIPRLLDEGYRVRALARSPEKLAGRPWADHPHLEIIKGDVLDPESLAAAVSSCRAAYYLVHSMLPGVADFAAADRSAANNMAAAAAQAELEQIIYLSGLGEDSAPLSHHLQSRTEVGDCLRQGDVPVTILRAAMIIGSGSASFEILRYLVDRLPAMVTPRWVSTPCQPIGVRNVLHYLIGCLEQPRTVGRTFDIGQKEVTNYLELMQTYAEEAGLRKRIIFPLPLLTPRLSSYWIHLVTPVPASIARPLAEGLSNPVICSENSITELLPQELFDARKAIRLALDRIRQQQVETTWTDSGILKPAEWSTAGDPNWSGGSAFEDSRTLTLEATADEVWPAVTSIGGEVGYYYANWLWKIRGLIDRLSGGVGLGRGRRSAPALYPGDVIDFWRILAIKPGHQLLLVAEMKLPGKATLSFKLSENEQGITTLQQTARFMPRGLFGLLYWYAVTPFHFFVFDGMLRGIAKATGKPVTAGPTKVKTTDG